MALPLQKAPLGLTGAFSLKVGGRNPYGFGESVLPIVDVYDQYLAQTELGFTIATTAIGLNNFALNTAIVPNGKFWRVFGASFSASLNGADAALTASCNIDIVNPAGVGIIIAADSIAAVRVERQFGWSIATPYVLPPGWKIITNVTFSAALTVSVNANYCVFRQEIDA